MAAIVTNNFRISNAQQWVNQVSDDRYGSHYLFVGRPQPFALHTGGGSDQIPPHPVDNEDTNYMVWRDMIAARFIGESDVSVAVARHDWQRDVPYDYYRSDYGSVVNGAPVTTLNGNWDMFETNSAMYVKAKHNVYKCLWNNYGAQSIEEPSGNSVKEFTTSDGYVWKFMYSISATDDIRFVTSDFHAVHVDEDVKAAAVDGAISQYHIANKGRGYEDGDYLDQPLVGDGEGGTFNLVVKNNEVYSIEASIVGSGYSYAYLNIDDIVGIGTPQTSAWITAIIPPPGGHGFDPTKELGGFYAIANTILAGEEGEGDFVVDQEFRRIGLMKDPYDYGTTNLATSDTLNALKSMTFHVGFSEYWPNDERIVGSTSGATALISHFSINTGNLKYIQPQWSGEINLDGLDHDPKVSEADFIIGESVTSESGATGVVRTVQPPEVEYYSGSILYIENRAPIVRSADQTENIKLIIEF